MDFKKCKLKGIVICKPQLFKDSRGFFAEIFRKDQLEKYLNKKVDICQSNTSHSKYGTVRGLHFQHSEASQSKLVSVSFGEILDVVVDLRRKSETFGKVFSIIINDKNNLGLFIPKGFAHGFSVLSDYARVNYHVDSYYNKNRESGINPFDSELNIDWKISNKSVLISEKDSKLPNFSDYKF